MEKKKKQYGYFNQQIEEIVIEMPWTWLRREKLKRKTESLFIAAENNAMRRNYIKVKINNMQKNTKRTVLGDRV